MRPVDELPATVAATKPEEPFDDPVEPPTTVAATEDEPPPEEKPVLPVEAPPDELNPVEPDEDELRPVDELPATVAATEPLEEPPITVAATELDPPITVAATEPELELRPVELPPPVIPLLPPLVPFAACGVTCESYLPGRMLICAHEGFAMREILAARKAFLYATFMYPPKIWLLFCAWENSYSSPCALDSENIRFALI